MKKIDAEILTYYTKEITKMIVEKYGYTFMEALRSFVTSKTHDLLEEQKNGMTIYGAGAIFDMWEVEKITGDPCNSVYIREE